MRMIVFFHNKYDAVKQIKGTLGKVNDFMNSCWWLNAEVLMRFSMKCL